VVPAIVPRFNVVVSDSDSGAISVKAPGGGGGHQGEIIRVQEVAVGDERSSQAKIREVETQCSVVLGAEILAEDL
jgi:hypothetical protein